MPLLTSSLTSPSKSKTLGNGTNSEVQTIDLGVNKNDVDSLIDDRYIIDVLMNEISIGDVVIDVCEDLELGKFLILTSKRKKHDIQYL